jgi:S-DNA-T family DNA segregation ATPase FtsK/SpoIIIE
MAAVCFVLAVFSFIGYFDAEPVFIAFLTGFVKRLIGNGFFALPPTLLLCSVILIFHRGRPVLFRIICTLSLTIAIGALVHLFTSDYDYSAGFLMIGELWRNGAELSSGGVVGGAIAELFLWLFGRVGASIAFIIAALFFLMVAFNRTIVGIIEALKKRERRQYIPEPRYELEPGEESLQRPQKRPLIMKRKRGIDIPIDGEECAVMPDYFGKKPEGELFKGSPGVKTPDQIIGKIKDDEQPPEPQHTEEEYSPAVEIEDMPLDIPFMEGKRRSTTTMKPAVTGPLPIKEEKPATEAKPSPETAAESAQPELSAKPDASVSGEVKKQAEMIEPVKLDPEISYTFPPLGLLSVGAPKSRAGDDEVRVNKERLEAAFQSFGVNVSISNATRGPSVTRYEAELEAGIKLSKLTSLADDIALSLGTSGVRIAAMPNKISTVGIEVPNKNISVVYLRDVVESQKFTSAKSKLTFAIGMDISGEPIVGDVSKLPHMLVAGTTGSGKSVCMNSIILSILYKATPEDVRFIMIDPKMVEFKVYNDIPHLLVPVVTDIKKAAGALQWATIQMMKRYTLFAETNARDIEGYNQVARKSKGEREALPQIIVVIDELADLMMMAAKEVEESVCRVAQMGRAAGIHLIIATQSPRANVITGLMKANIPSRIAFKVASALESQIILDPGQNADKLVGNGDMLYAPTGSSKPLRLQGTWVSDKEREKVIDFIKKSGESQYSEEVMGEIEKASAEKPTGEKPQGDSDGNDYDELLPQAVDVIFETGQASVSMLQRRLKLGYSRAARIVDQMEEIGIVGPFEGSKPRTVLITKDQWRQMQYISGTAPVDGADPVAPPADSGDDQLPDRED